MTVPAPEMDVGLRWYAEHSRLRSIVDQKLEEDVRQRKALLSAATNETKTTGLAVHRDTDARATGPSRIAIWM